MLNMAISTLSSLPTMGAWGGFELFVFAIAIIFTVGGWVMNNIKKIKEHNEAKERLRNSTYRSERKAMRIGGDDDDDDDELEEISPANSMTTKERLDALAARRRAQMASVRAQSSRTGPAASSEPDNLTAAQRAARDRAKKAYQRRAEQLAKQQDSQREAARQNAERARAQQQAQARADAATKARRAQSSRSTSSSQSQSQSQNQSSSQSQSQAARQRQAALQRAQSQRSTARSSKRAALSTDPNRRIHRTGPLEVQKLDGKVTINDESLEVVKNNAGAAVPADRLKRALTGKSIRAAFVLKEVLDRPIALREDEDLPGALNFK